ncbi:thioredoxin-like domain-containing protein [Luteolibacter sp. AS25]|uniref:thioredoxin-like domain-containing protein n=1 Tax=Luteolibacter sp. AS25 TaxID=3135776 RepID=UPI00398BB18B
MKFPLIFLSSILLTGVSYGEFRTWTRNDGKSAELELTKTSGEVGSKVGTFKMRNGRLVDLPSVALSTEDAKLVEEWKSESQIAEESASATESVFDELLEGNLEKFDGRSLKRYELEQKPTKYYLFYYTASWCPPCQKFTPDLVKFYKSKRPKHDEFEIVLVTSDDNEDAMEGYAKEKKMEWPHLKLSKVDNFKKTFKHPGTGIPNLVLTDLEGNLIKTSYVGKDYMGPASVMNHLEGLLK